METHDPVLEGPTELAAELSRCRALLAETQALAGIGHWEWDIATDRLTWSDEHYRIYGLPIGCFRTKADLVAKMPPARREAFEAHVARALIDHQPYLMEATIRRPDGEERIVHGRGRVVLGEDGRPVRFVGTTQDITERVRSEQCLRDQEAQLRAIVDHSTDHILIRDLEGRFLLMNPCGAAAMGRAPAELIGLESEAIFDAATAARIRATDRQVLETGQPLEYEARLDLRDGRSLVARTLKYPYRAPDGRIAGVVALSRDITEQAQARALLHRKEAEFHALIEKLPVMVARLDAKGRYVYVNRAIEATSGRPRAWYLGRTYRELGYPAQVADALERQLLEAIEQGEEQVTEFVWELADGPRWYQRRLVPMMGLDGRPETVLSVLLDITERQRQLEELEALSRLRSQFVSAVSHELRTPLTSLMGYAEFLDEGIAGGLNDGQLAFVSAIRANAGRLSRLVDDLLDCAASESGTFHLERGATDLVPMVATCLGVMAPQARQAGIALRSEIEALALPVYADGERILQVLGNLVGNALKFTPEGGAIVVRAYREPGGLRCEVQDDGPGIPVEQQEKLFERFRQAAPTSPRMGLGLGLAISRTIVEAHGGRIGVESAPGEGSTFWFTLPA